MDAHEGEFSVSRLLNCELLNVATLLNISCPLTGEAKYGAKKEATLVRIQEIKGIFSTFKQLVRSHKSTLKGLKGSSIW